MTQTISVVHSQVCGTGRGPDLRVVLVCERHPSGLLNAPSWSAEGPDYIELRKQAAKAGWVRADGGVWLCPECSK